MLQIASGLIAELSLIDPSIGSPDPKKCLFRQNRDIRFSINKNPYKTNMGAYFSSGGKNLPMAGYYLHIEPNASFFGGGLYMPEKAQLQKIRSEIYFNAHAFESILNEKRFKETFGQLMDEKLKRPPKGFPSDIPHIELLKYTSFAVSCTFQAENCTPADIIRQGTHTFSIMAPLVKYLNHALSFDQD
jgi:uncharacterized protein (TIGR02453 family)